ncbi:putative selenium-dependent hydroxylase accessory protein YqeC [Clostridium saudiense]|nr:putative selenium-dependent hydroxylase accessory protein YqeC [Clostridium saudiense]
MNVIENKGNQSVSIEYLHEGLEIDLNKKYVISFVGGGGKTTSIYKLADELTKKGKKVIVTTTTHMQMPKDKVILNNNIYYINKMLEEGNFVTVGIKTKNDKISSVSLEKVNELKEICDFLLIEADGAKMLPLKAPDSHEPVILNISNMVVGVCGIDALGKKIKDTCHRAAIVSKIIRKSEEDIVEIDDIASILSSKEGTRKDVDTDTMEYRVIINKVDNNELLEKATKISKKLECKNIKSIMTSYI